MINADPMASLIDYVKTIKPYHTKIYEVLLSYVYGEPVNVSITDKVQFHILMTNIESNPWAVYPGMGWDTTPWDWNDPTMPGSYGSWDQQVENTEITPSTVLATITETLSFEISNYLNDLVFTYVDDNSESLGWDLVPWDHSPWDYGYPTTQMKVNTEPVDPVGTTFTETLTITVHEISNM